MENHVTMTTSMDRNNEQRRTWTLPVDEDGVLLLPDELVELTGWQEGDDLEWIDQGDGSFVLQKLINDGSNQAPNDARND